MAAAPDLLETAGPGGDHWSTSRRQSLATSPSSAWPASIPGPTACAAYWENILGRVDAVTEVPADHWDWRLYYDPDPRARDKIISKWGGFLGDMPFDPLVFGMPPNSLTSIEPVQLFAAGSGPARPGRRRLRRPALRPRAHRRRSWASAAAAARWLSPTASAPACRCWTRCPACTMRLGRRS